MSEWKAMIPVFVEGRARSSKRLGFAFGYRFFLLVLIGFVWLILAFADHRFVYALLLWDFLIVVAWAIDLAALPSAGKLTFRRSWTSPLELSESSNAVITAVSEARSGLHVQLWDAIPSSLRRDPPRLEMKVPARGRAESQYSITPIRRGPTFASVLNLRYEGMLRLAQRWATAELKQELMVYPNLHEAKRQAVYLIRSRQINMEKRFSRIRGAGKSFESLREYRNGDDFADICWTATARRGKLVTRLYELEKSQTVWLVLDTGRLMRTRVAAVSKLDHAVNAGLALSQVALLTGDRVGLLAYGRGVQLKVPARRGSSHLRQFVETLAHVREEESEADHLRAASQLMRDQKRRSLVVWITELAETAMTPEVVDAASKLLPRHVVLIAVIGQPDLRMLASNRPNNVADMYQISAAQEVIHRRELLLARLRERGALAVEVECSELAATLVNSYLQVKQREQL